MSANRYRLDILRVTPRKGSNARDAWRWRLWRGRNMLCSPDQEFSRRIDCVRNAEASTGFAAGIAIVCGWHQVDRVRFPAGVLEKDIAHVRLLDERKAAKS